MITKDASELDLRLDFWSRMKTVRGITRRSEVPLTHRSLYLAKSRFSPGRRGAVCSQSDVQSAVVRDGAKARGNIYNVRREDTWVVHKNLGDIAFRSSEVLVICRRTGRVLYEGLAHDEGERSTAALTFQSVSNLSSTGSPRLPAEALYLLPPKRGGRRVWGEAFPSSKI